MLGSRSLLPNIVFPFIAYLLLFVGMGLIAGSVVHMGEISQISRYIAIGSVGMVMFVVGSYWQEIHINPKQLPRQELLRYVLWSLLLAVGIGMISGGTQHFLDFPIYASFLLPGGLFLAIAAYVLRSHLKLSFKAWNLLLVGTLAIALPLFLGLSHYAHTLPSGTGHGHGAHGQTESMQSALPASSEHSSSAHSAMVAIASDRDFLLEMIPHHQEAVDTSAYLLTRTSDPALKTFVQSVIQVQSQEVEQMKQWYQQWIGQPYAPVGTYRPMMSNLPKAEGPALENAYLQGMIVHHQGAIAMAQQIQPLSQRPELLQFAQGIIQTQSQEVSQLEHWLGDRQIGQGIHQH